MTSTTVKDIDGNAVTVRVGDIVGFKSDVEQSGVIFAIRRNDFSRKIELVLTNPSGFEGEYIRGLTRTVVWADDCWI